MKNKSWITPDLQHRIRILVVEDNHLNQKLDSFLLESWGLKHEICSNGLEAVERLKAGRFDVVLMDIRMPELDGYEATRIIREDLQLKVPVIGVTAHASPSEKAMCVAAGMSNYLSKPVDEEELLGLLHGFLANRPAETEPSVTGD